MAVLEAEAGDGVRFNLTEIATRGQQAVALDVIRLFPEVVNYYGLVLREALRLREEVTGPGVYNETLADVLKLVDKLAQARDAAWGDAIQFADTALLQEAIAIIERLGLSEALVGNGVYHLSLRQAMRLADSLLRFYSADIVDELGIDATLLGRALAMARIDDALELAPVVVPQLLMSVKAVDAIKLQATDAVRMLFQPHLFEGVEFEAGYLAPDGSFTTWAMNTRTGAVTEYADFVFNSFAEVGSRYYGASADGLYELLGDDDDGENIVARIAGGFMQFGGTRLSRLKAAYIAADGEGQMWLKIEEAGGKTYVYRTDTRDMRSTKVHMGKGQRARYFAFELTTEGQDFDLDTIEFVPIVVSRRV